MRRIPLLFVLIAACTPQQRVENPHAKRLKSPDPAVDRDVTLDVAPGGVVLAKDGSNVDLGTLWVSQRAVVVFYMGGWCPHCQKQLGDLNDAQKKFNERGARIIAISADSTDEAKAMSDKLRLGFDLYSDPQLAVIAKWGVADHGSNIARPSTFIVEPGGSISYRKVGSKPEERATVDQILAALGDAKPAAQ
ncbi:MAG: redoxin domain-containing protein [Deltaproteobacteria bacterium]|nr:redoxin domain-containing protein [Deltaproteobacteria bacterium]